VKPVAASSVWHRAPVRAMTRGSPNRKGWGPLPRRVNGGMRNPLKGWTRKDAALTDTFSLQDPPVASTGLGLQSVEVGSRAWQPRSRGC
jgi:hypothetical protein